LNQRKRKQKRIQLLTDLLQRLERNPTSSRRKAIILEVGTLGHILLTSSLFRIIVGAERGFWPAFGPTFRKRTIKRGPKGSSRNLLLLFLLLLEVNSWL
jgi:hypothetical protein